MESLEKVFSGVIYLNIKHDTAKISENVVIINTHNIRINPDEYSNVSIFDNVIKAINIFPWK